MGGAFFSGIFRVSVIWRNRASREKTAINRCRGHHRELQIHAPLQISSVFYSITSSPREPLSDSSCLHTKRPEFFAARFTEVAKNVDGVLVDHFAQLKKRLVWLQIHIGNLLPDLLGTGEDFRR
jgi:hypothetical protein